MGTPMLSLILKQLMRGNGLKICIAATFMLAILVKAVGTKVPNIILVLCIVSPASISSMAVDLRTHYSMFRALYMVGASPRQIKTYALLIPATLSGIYALPYITIGVMYVILTFTLSLTSSAAVMLFILHVVRKGFTSSIRS